MRLDKFLKVSRIIKRRTVAKELADKGRIVINDKTAKSSTDVKIGDEMVLTFGNKQMRIKVLKINETVKKEEAKDLYEILGETYQETL